MGGPVESMVVAEQRDGVGELVRVSKGHSGGRSLEAFGASSTVGASGAGRSVLIRSVWMDMRVVVRAAKVMSDSQRASITLPMMSRGSVDVRKDSAAGRKTGTGRGPGHGSE